MRIEEAAGLLGVATDAPPEALQAAYRRLALRWQQQQSQSKPQQSTAAAGGGSGAKVGEGGEGGVVDSLR
jgi:hypothetical protein